MTEKFFKVKLLSDVVLNSRLATEGNMTTLEYIPGSNFLGIVASKIYPDKSVSDTDKYEIFHSGNISFGDATISNNDEISYPVPFDFMMVKGEDKLGENQVYLQHLLTESNHPKSKDGFKEQLKQQRSGYITSTGKAITKIRKTFALKSAQDAGQRRSKEGAMFGFESLKAGQEFIFSVQFRSGEHIENVCSALTGNKRIGKSKTAQYGQIEISELTISDRIKKFASDNYSLVYVQSHLCVFDEFGLPTLQPQAKDLGLNGDIEWDKSMIRTYSYSPWNGQRNTNDTLRTCIAAGSVLYINGKNDSAEKSAGVFQSEGLGRIMINPVFLKGDAEAKSTFAFSSEQKEKPKQKAANGFNTSLGKFLLEKELQHQNDLKLSKAIQEQFESTKSQFSEEVTSSQWGAIRKYSSEKSDIAELEKSLWGEENVVKGYLKHGVAYERIWSKGQNTKNLEKVFVEANKSSNPTIFIAKFAAEMAKYVQNKKNSDEK